MPIMRIKIVLFFTLIFILLNTYVYSEEGKRRAPIYVNKDGRGETIQFLDTVKIVQTRGQQFTPSQLDETVAVLDKTTPKVRSHISSINAVNQADKSFGGSTDKKNNISININGASTTGDRNYTDVVIHEVGHVAFSTLSEKDQKKFNDLHYNSRSRADFATSDYPAAYRSSGEDFAETYRKYYTGPQTSKVSFILNQKMEIVRNNFGAK